MLALLLCIAGIFRPFMSMTKLWLFEHPISVRDGLITLWNESELFLFVILLAFTVIFPLVKNLSLLALEWSSGPARGRDVQLHRFIAQLGKWSMLDVFVVAILVLSLKSGGLATMRVEDGAFLFCGSVLLTQCASAWMGRITRHRAYVRLACAGA
jgi:paraquat-inducible protein A